MALSSTRGNILQYESFEDLSDFIPDYQEKNDVAS